MEWEEGQNKSNRGKERDSFREDQNKLSVSVRVGVCLCFKCGGGTGGACLLCVCVW